MIKTLKKLRKLYAILGYGRGLTIKVREEFKKYKAMNWIEKTKFNKLLDEQLA